MVTRNRRHFFPISQGRLQAGLNFGNWRHAMDFKARRLNPKKMSSYWQGERACYGIKREHRVSNTVWLCHGVFQSIGYHLTLWLMSFYCSHQIMPSVLWCLPYLIIENKLPSVLFWKGFKESFGEDRGFTWGATREPFLLALHSRSWRGGGAVLHSCQE